MSIVVVWAKRHGLLAYPPKFYSKVPGRGLFTYDSGDYKLTRRLQRVGTGTACGWLMRLPRRKGYLYFMPLWDHPSWVRRP